MAAYLPLREGAPVLRGRGSECGALDRLIEAVRAGASRVLVVRGESGVGKTALLDYLAGHAPGCRVVRAAGVETEMEFAFAGLHQLCAPMLDHLGRLPVPQREAGGLSAAAAFGERAALLTPGPARRAQRMLAAAQAKYRAGALDAALELLVAARAGPPDALRA